MPALDDLNYQGCCSYLLDMLSLCGCSELNHKLSLGGNESFLGLLSEMTSSHGGEDVSFLKVLPQFIYCPQATRAETMPSHACLGSSQK